MRVRPAEPADELAVRRVLDAAMLDVSLPALDAGFVFVAEAESRVLGALVCAPHERGGGVHIDAVAVRRSRRDAGIGTRLVERVRETYGRVTADCRPGVAPFYESLGFRVFEIEGRAYAVSP